MPKQLQTSTKAPTKNGTVVAPCKCTHKFQDSIYGAGRRLHNLCAKGLKRRCTVCSAEVML